MAMTAGLSPPIQVLKLDTRMIRRPAMVLGLRLIFPEYQAALSGQLNTAPMAFGLQVVRKTMFSDQPMVRIAGRKLPASPPVPPKYFAWQLTATAFGWLQGLAQRFLSRTMMA